MCAKHCGCQKKEWARLRTCTVNIRMDLAQQLQTVLQEGGFNKDTSFLSPAKRRTSVDDLHVGSPSGCG